MNLFEMVAMIRSGLMVATSWSAERSNCVCDWEYAQIAESEE